MHTDKIKEILRYLFEAGDLIYTLKAALSNEDQPGKDTTAYSAVAEMIEHKIYSVTDLITDMIEDT